MLSSCFSVFSPFAKLSSSTPSEAKTACVFCNVSTQNGFNIVYEDADYTVFKDRSPPSLSGTLVRADNVRSLTQADVPMVREMARIGSKVLLGLGVQPEQQRMGFHIPPFFSVNHLHLHLLSLPLPAKSAIKYRAAFPTPPAHATKDPQAMTKVKGWAWFVEVGQVLRILEGGERVKIASVAVRGG